MLCALQSVILRIIIARPDAVGEEGDERGERNEENHATVDPGENRYLKITNMCKSQHC